MKIKPYYVDYLKWECYKNNMYKNTKNKYIIIKCYNFFKLDELFIYDMMKLTIKKYKNSSKFKLSNNIYNPISWLGQATCNNLFGASYFEVTEAWNKLQLKDKRIANKCAKKQ